MRYARLTAAAFVAVFSAAGFAQSNIDSTNKYAWSENIGWTNWRDANGTTDGVIVGSDFLSGFVWGENVGWIDVGDGNGPYANTNDTNYGVNILANDNLSGYAWGENIGWINFDTSGNAPNQARFDFSAGRFRGYAWGENVGWINLDDGVHFVAANLAPDPPDVGNDVCSGGANNGLACSQNSDCPGGFCGMKNRYISVTPQNIGDQTVIQVTALTLPASLAAFVGDVWYADAAALVNENPAPGPTMWTATLACNNGELRDWGADGLVNITGAIIVPGATYEVRQCTAVAGLCSNPLVVGTNKHGDVVAPLVNLQPNFQDISAMVSKFQAQPGSISKSRAQMQPNIPNPPSNINFLDISAVVGAFQGQLYGFPAAGCP